MCIIDKNTFENLDRDKKRKLNKMYLSFKEARFKNQTELMEKIFDKECLGYMSHDIKTWDEVIFFNPTMNQRIISHLVGWCSDTVYKKMEATAKIAKLIEVGYGGMVTEEEWKKSVSYNQEDIIWTVLCEYNENKELQLRVAANWTQPEMVSFHTKEQAEEFISYPENVELVKQYYMI